jgi:tetratricopeptide (TPR) repeat protein
MKDLVFEPTSLKEAEASHLASPQSNGSVALDLQWLAALRDDLAACFDILDAERIITAAQQLHSHSSGPEHAALFAEMEAELSHGRLAVAALAQDQIDECRQHCDAVLREKPHHTLFLGLRVKANAAARAAEYSEQMAAIAHIRSLLDCGPLEDAQNASKSALARFPDSPELCELDLDIREKAIHLRNLVERGETALDIFDVEGAGECFLRACEQLPFDLSLSGYIVSVLHEFAARAEDKNRQAAQAALDLAQRIQPGTQPPETKSQPSVPAELEVLDNEMLAAEQKSNSALPLGGELDTAAVLRDSSRALAQPTLIDLNPSTRNLKSMGLALAVACALFIAYRIAQPTLSPPRHVLEIPVAAAGSLTIHSNVAGAHMLINNRPFDMPAGSLTTTIKLPPDVYAIRATHPGYEAAGPIAAPVKDGAASEIEVDLKPLSASLEIRHAIPGMKVSLDGRPLGAVSKDGTLHSSVAPGQHTLKLTQNGFLSKTIHANFAPGEALAMTDPQVTLDSTDARALPHQPAKSDVADLLTTLPPAMHAPSPSLHLEPPPPPAPPTANLERRPSLALPESHKALHVPSAQELADSAAVLAVLQRFATAWSAKDLKAITGIESDLDKRALKTQLAAVKLLSMKISPVMPPQIDGAQATVVCRRQASETFSDGSARQNPPALVTYVLAKREGVWRIEHAQ